MEDKRIDLTGQRFFRLTVVSFAGVNRRGQALWRVRCDCGTERSVRGDNLRNGTTGSCGCWKAMCATLITLRHGHARRGGSRSPEYRSWQNMLQRCTNPKDQDWKNWGGRGIRVCDRWLHSFENFFVDMGRKPSPAHSIDRSNNDGNYEPGNCCWATAKEQRANRRDSRKKAA
jgi:hypothetical protein